MQVANTLAFYDMAIITAVKSFIVQAPEFGSRLRNFHFASRLSDLIKRVGDI
jgi:hypothetical protein